MTASSTSQTLTSSWRIDTSRTANARPDDQPQVRIVRVQLPDPDPELIQLVPPQDAYQLSIHIAPIQLGELHLGRRRLPTSAWPAGTITMPYLADEPLANRTTGLDAIMTYLPRAAFDDLAREHDARPGTPNVPWGAADPIVMNLGAALLPALAHAQGPSGLFVDHVVLALLMHLTDRYASVQLRSTPRAGTLAPWQLRRVTALMDAKIASSVSLAQLATECNLSRSYFTRAFKRSTGTSPYRWLLERRIDRAKQLLRATELPLAQIACDVGFASQSRFTRTFSQLVGTSPGAWRRHYRH